MKIVILVFVLPSYLFATISIELEQFIQKRLVALGTIQQWDYNDTQKKTLIDRFIDGVAEKFNTSVTSADHEALKSMIFQYIKTINREGEELPSLGPQFATLLNDLAAQLHTKIKNNLLNFSFEGYLVPLRAFSANNKNFLVLDGIEITQSPLRVGSRSPCLRLVLTADNIHIDQLGTKLQACVTPKENAGTFLLNLAEEIAKALHIRSITLEDKSKVRCSQNNQMASLRVLSLLKKGLSWYGSHGYATLEGAENDRLEGGRLHSFPLETVEQELNETANRLDELKEEASKRPFGGQELISYYEDFDALKSLFDQKVTEYKKGHADSELGPFLFWIWKTSCAAYLELNELLFPSISNGVLGFNWLIPTETYMVKSL